MKIYLIRHGQTDWNILGKIQGSCNIPLNQTGRMQAERLAEGMVFRPVKKVFSSTLMRAVETAKEVARSQNANIVPMESLMEVKFGKWEGLTRAEMEKEYPEEYLHWCEDPAATAPGGESLEEITDRCHRAIKEILKDTGGKEDAAVVSHGATIVHLISCMAPEGAESGDIIVENASITTLEYDPVTGKFVLLGLNDTVHLK